MTRYDVLIRGGASFDDWYLATSFGFTRQKTLGIPQTAVEREGL